MKMPITIFSNLVIYYNIENCYIKNKIAYMFKPEIIYIQNISTCIKKRNVNVIHIRFIYKIK